MYQLDKHPELQRQAELMALGELFADYGGEKIAMEEIRHRGSVAKFMRRVSEAAQHKPLADAADALLGLDSKEEFRGYSLTRGLRASLERNWSGAGFEKEISNLVTTRTGAVPNGFFVPLSFLARDFNAGTASQAGNLIGSGIDASRVADPLRNAAMLGRLGATFLSGLKLTLSLPRFESSSDAAWKDEIEAATALTESTVMAVLTPKRIPVTLTMSRQALLQATPALDVTIARHLTKAILEKVEHGAINGDGTGNAPVGLRSTSGVGSVVGGTNGAQLTFAHLADLEAAPALADAEETDYAGFAVNAATRRWLRTQPRGSGLPYAWDGGERPLLGYRAGVSRTLPSDLTKGTSSGVCSTLCYSADWREMVIGVYGGGVDVMLDRVTLADQGKVRIIASLQVGVGVNLPAAFAKMDDALTA
jgi:HK97 family phage major capsid protein